MSLPPSLSAKNVTAGQLPLTRGFGFPGGTSGLLSLVWDPRLLFRKNAQIAISAFFLIQVFPSNIFSLALPTGI